MANPQFLGEMGLGADKPTRQAYDLLEGIISRRGRSRSNRAAEGLRRRGGAGSLHSLGALAAQEAGIAEQRKMKDLGLVDALITQPALQNRNLGLNDLRMQVGNEVAGFQQKNQQLQALSSIMSTVADIRQAYKNKNTAPQTAVPERQ